MLLPFDHYSIAIHYSNADHYSILTESIKGNDSKRIHRYLDTLRILYSQQED